MPLSLKQLVERFRLNQYDQKQLIKDLQLLITDLAYNFKAIEEYGFLGPDALDDLTARVEALEAGSPYAPLVHNHDSRYYTESEIDSLFTAYYTKIQIDAMLAGMTPDAWGSQPIGVPIGVMDSIAGVAAPSTSLGYRYIKLTASDVYNTGVLTSQSVSGISPNITATAVVSLSGSPINGQTVALINSDRRFLRAGSSGTKEQSQNLSHNHTGTADAVGNHQHGTGFGGSYGQSASGSGPNGAIAGGDASGAAGAHGHTLTIAANGGTEARPANIGVTYFMRIL